MTNDLPISSTTVEKSVPRIAILAVGVLSVMFCFAILFNEPLTNRVVPIAKVKAIFDFDGSGS